MKSAMDQKTNDNLADHMILSHLSSKRKDYDILKFEKIFEKFDEDFEKEFNIIGNAKKKRKGKGVDED